MKFVWIYVIILLCFFSCTNTSKTNNYITIQGYTQGTYYSITYNQNSNQNIQKSIDSLLHKFDLQFSNYIPNSIISRINTNDSTVTTTAEFEYFWKKAIQINDITYGFFDISITDIINAWNFGFKNQKGLPTKHSIDSLMKFKGMHTMKIANHRFIKEIPQAKIVSNAIAQGYAVDIVCDFLKKQKITDYLVDIGGEIKAHGVNPEGKYWTIGITKPIDTIDSLPIEQSYYVTASLDNKALATSGNYRKFYKINGVKYSHIINPVTGYPAQNNILSASVFANECIDADAIATACMIMSIDSLKQFFIKYPQYDAIIMYNIKDSIHLFKTKNADFKYVANTNNTY